MEEIVSYSANLRDYILSNSKKILSVFEIILVVVSFIFIAGAASPANYIPKITALVLGIFVFAVQVAILIITPIRERKQHMFYVLPQMLFYVDFIAFYTNNVFELALGYIEPWTQALLLHMVFTMAWKEKIAFFRAIKKAN